VDDDLENEVSVTVLATGFSQQQDKPSERATDIPDFLSGLRT
jgi:cell division GTPase FtsZ